MKTVIDGKINKSVNSIHEKLAADLDFGPYYGKNLDALWDVLTTDVERPFEICVVNIDEFETLGDEFKKVIDLLKEVEQRDIASNYEEKFKLTIENEV